MRTNPLPVLIAAMLGLGCRPEPPPTGPIVVYWTVDTLGLVAAKETGWCERIGEITGAHGLDAACLDGAVAPSSWTGETHTRTLFPQHRWGALRLRQSPACDEPSMLGLLAERNNATYVFGSDNSVLGPKRPGDCMTRNPWHMGAHAVYVTDLQAHGLAPLDPDARPLKTAVERILDEVGAGRAVVAFLNSFEVGGHFPRCWMDPETEACEALWALAVEGGVVAPDADRVSTWLSDDFIDDFFEYAFQQAGREAELRPHFWETMKQNVEHHRGPLFDERLERLLTGLETMGRLDDLTIVIVGDHGENPGVTFPFTGRFHPKHGGLPTEWTAIVPVFVVPASRATEWESYVGDAERPWSTVNLSYALAGDEVPSTWGEMEPVGTATSWACATKDTIASAGIHVEGDLSLRCEGVDCGAWTWRIPDDLMYEPEPLDAIPEPFSPYVASPNFFQEACVDESQL